MTNHQGSEKCGVKGAIVFVIALVAGTGCTIASKALFTTESIGITGQPEVFQPPLFQTWVMFVGMMFALPVHFLDSFMKKRAARTDPELAAVLASQPPVTAKTYVLLAIPSVFDLLATCLMVFGLMWVNASIWMLIRGGGIVFVALMKAFVMKHEVTLNMWVGVGVITAAVVMVGVSSTCSGDSHGMQLSQTLWGLFLTVAGTFMQSVQYCYEESVMSGECSAPPWLLVGVEGLCGTLLSTFVLYPLVYALPGADHGHFEDFHNTLALLQNNHFTVLLALTFCVLVFVLNSLSVLVTYLMSSVWHAILDNFRPVTIWLVQLSLYYIFTDGQYGERWTNASWLQLLGMVVLLFGTAIYNGSVGLPGFEPPADLFKTNSLMSSPAMLRSPLLIQGSHPISLGIGAQTMVTSPYSVQPALHGQPAAELEASLINRAGRAMTHEP